MATLCNLSQRRPSGNINGFRGNYLRKKMLQPMRKYNNNDPSSPRRMRLSGPRLAQM